MLTQKGALTLSELSSQGDVWKQVIQTVDKEQQKIVPWFMKEGFTAVVFTGAGSSLNAARVCKRFFSDFTGVTSGCFPPSEIFAGLRLPFLSYCKNIIDNSCSRFSSSSFGRYCFIDTCSQGRKPYNNKIIYKFYFGF